MDNLTASGVAQIGAYLHHLVLLSSDPKRMAQFYADVMDMEQAQAVDGEWRCEGPNRRMVFQEGQSNVLSYAGFACPSQSDLNQLQRHIEEQDELVSPCETGYFGAGAFSVCDPDGNRIVFGVPNSNSETPRHGMPGALQHLVFASHDVEAFQRFYGDNLGFTITDRVLHANGDLATCFLTSTNEHHTIGCFKAKHKGIDHHCYEAVEWSYIRDWCDHFARHDSPVIWGPGRHGPGNNLFVFIADPDGNMVEISAELEIVRGRPARDWPQSERTLNLWGTGRLRS